MTFLSTGKKLSHQQILIFSRYQIVISSQVETSHQKREQSKQLLEIAKIGVERAIETDEATAIDWINQQLADLGVTL
jgi:uncharacterized protein YktB (UPF0637 family)